MKFATLFIIASGGFYVEALSYYNAQRIVLRWDRNHDGCLEWPEFKHAAAEHLMKHNIAGTPQQWQYLHNVFNNSVDDHIHMYGWT